MVIGCHGLLSTSQSPKQLALAKHCNAAGISFFRFDHRGCGASEGKFDQVTTFQGRCNDLTNTLRKMKSLGIAGQRIGLFGSSLGGAVCMACAGLEGVTSLVVFAAPYQSHFANHLHLSNQLSFDLTDIIPDIGNVQIIHGDKDEVVPLAHAHFIYNHAKDPKKLIIQKKGDHRMSDRSHQTSFLQATVSWFKQALFIL